MSAESQLVKSFKLSDPYLIQYQKNNLSLEKHAVGAERAVNHSLWGPVDHYPATITVLKAEPTSYSMEGDRIHVMGTQYENGLFSSSLSELFSRKLRLKSIDALHGHSVGATASHYEEEEPFESIEEIEAQTIGNLLPNDDDLLSGMTDGLDYMARCNTGEDIEDLDLFSSVGGFDLGEDGFPSGQRDSKDRQLGGSISSVVGEHPYGEHPSRTLFVRNINSNVEDSELQALFEQFGVIRTLYTACKHRGFVMISFYDIRAAQKAIRALQNKPLRRRNLDIHFSIPKICEAPHSSHHKFIEFYDVRAAEAALHALNSSDIAGKRIKLEPSRVGVARRLIPPFPTENEADQSAPYLQQSSSPSNLTTGFSGALSHSGNASSGMDNGTVPGVHSAIEGTTSPFIENLFHHGISSSVPNSLPSLLRVQSGLSGSGHSQGHLKIEFQGTLNFHPHSLPEYHDVLTNGAPCNSPSMASNISIRPSERVENRQFCRVSSNGHPLELNDAVFVSSANGSCPPPGHHYIWSNSHRPQPQGMMWSNSPTFINGVCTGHPASGLHSLPRAPSHMLNTLLPINSHYVGSAPSVNHSLWDRRHAYSGESPNASDFHPGSLGNMRISGNSPHHLDFLSPHIFPHAGGNCMDLSIASQNVGLRSDGCLMFPGRGQMIPMMSSFDSPNERVRSRRNEGSSNQADNKKQFELDIDRILRGEDNRTTLMIKNIPNKYTSKMLLAAIDERHRGTYDFIYLPIDFKNKCNVGYAFINMTDPSLIVPFYQVFHGKKWEKFNSEKVASLAYARIQGKTALIAHFQNSSLMNEDKRCRPILFNTDGPNAGDQVPFPVGVNVRSRPNKTQAITGDENNQESASNLSNGEESSNGDSLSGVTKDSDGARI